MTKIALTGIKPSGSPHVGNYLGMIRPALELARDHQALYFLADYHAMTTIKDPATLRRLSLEVAAAWLALGLDPERSVFYRQSDVPEVFELAWVLGCFTPKGLLNRAHAYKAAVDRNRETGRDTDEGVNAGLFGYPVLMAADILLFGSHVVPVGADQVQHMEITRDVAEAFNRVHGEILTLPDAIAGEVVPGIDGRKMSASYDNSIPVFAPPDEVRARVMRIVTDSTPREDPKDAEQCNLFAIYRHFATQEDVDAMRERYARGGLGYSEVKQELFERLESTFAPARERYDALMRDPGRIDAVLADGAKKARAMARPMIEKVRRAVGIEEAAS